MAVIQNKATESGDILIIKSEVPIIGILTLLDFIDGVSGETAGKYFNKEFRYSVDGINYTAWEALTTLNVQNISVQSNDTFFVEYRYQRVGLDNTGQIDFNFVELQGEYENNPSGSAWSNSNFEQYLDYNAICTISWSIYVLEKLYKKGILPNYIERGKQNSNEEDRDFIDFWRTITHYYALYVCLARFYQKFYTNPDLLCEFLIQRGAFVCQDDIDQIDFTYIMQSYLDEIRQRGTIQIVREKDKVFNLGDIKQVDGEYLRLICYDHSDAFLFNLNKNEHVGWNIGNSSPNYTGLTNRLNCNNYPIENITSALDFNTFGNGVVKTIVDSGRTVLKIETVTNGQVEGIGEDSVNHQIKVNPKIDYEITFMVKQPVGVENFSFGVKGYDIHGVQVDLLDVETLASSNFFCQKVTFNNSVYNLVRGTIYAYDTIIDYATNLDFKVGQIVRDSGQYYKTKRNTPPATSLFNTDFFDVISFNEAERLLRTSSYLGNNLIFQTNIVKILPYIVLDNTSNAGGTLQLYDIRVNPLNTKYSKGFIQTPNLLEIWNLNRNKTFSNEEVIKEAKHYLFPYNIVVIENWLREPDGEPAIEAQYKALLDPETGDPVLDPETPDGLIFILE